MEKRKPKIKLDERTEVEKLANQMISWDCWQTATDQAIRREGEEIMELTPNEQ